MTTTHLSAQTVMYVFQEKYGFDKDRSERVCIIARDCGLNNEPVTGGYVTVRYRYVQSSNLRYTIEENISKRVPQRGIVRYTHSKTPEPSPTRKKASKMPPRGRNAKAAEAAAEPDEAATPVKATREKSPLDFLDKDFSPTMNDYLDWAGQEGFDLAEIAKEDPERVFVLGSQLYGLFQKSELNITRRDKRKADREASNGEAEAEAKEEAPAKPVAAKPAPPRRGRPRAAAAATADY